jgi:ankyrin repeat protein
VHVVRWEDLLLGSDEAYQPQIPSPADPACIATICILGERLGSGISRFPDTPRGELPTDLAEYCAHHGISVAVEPKDYGPAHVLPMTGTLFEFLEACRGRGKVLLMIKADPNLVRNRDSNPIDRGFGLRQHLASVLASTGSAAATMSKRWSEYNEQIGWLARFYDNVVFAEGGARPHHIFGNVDELRLAVRNWLGRVLEAGDPTPAQLFKGAESYGVSDWPALFGRDADIRGIIGQLMSGQRREANSSRPFRVIYGRSGVGKSSLVKAGIAGRLEAQGSIASHRFAQGSIASHRFVAVELSLDDLGIEPLRRGKRPTVARLAKRIAMSARLPGLALEAWQHPPETPTALLNMLRPHLADACRNGKELIPVIVVDQFEEALKLRHNVGRLHEFDQYIAPLIAALDVLTFERLAWALICIPHELPSEHGPQNARAGERSLLMLWQGLVAAAVAQHGPIETHRISAAVDDTFLGAILRKPFESLGPGLDDAAYAAIREQLAPIMDGDHVPLPLVSAHLRGIYEKWVQRQARVRPAPADLEGESRGTMTQADVAGLELGDSINRLGEQAFAAFRRTGATDAERTFVRLFRHLVALGVEHVEGRSLVYTKLGAIGIGPSRSRGIGAPEVALAETLLRFRLLARVSSQKVRLVHACVLDYWRRAKDWLHSDSDLLLTHDDVKLQLEIEAHRARPGPIPVELLERSQKLLIAAADAEFLATDERRLIIEALKTHFSSLPGDGSHTQFLHAALRAREAELIAHYLAPENHQRLDLNAPETGDLRKPVLLVAAEEGQFDAIPLLLAAGADPTLSDAWGRTVLHALALAGDEQRAIASMGHVLSRTTRAFRQTFLDQPARPNGWTALHLSAAQGSTAFANALLEAGSNRMLQSRSGFLAIHFAARHANRDLLDLFLRSHPRLQTAFPVREGENVLMHAAVWGSADTVAILLEKKAKLQASDAHGTTALHHAARAGNVSTLGALLERAQRSHPTLIDLPDREGQTPLLTACRNGQLEAVRLLLRHGCKTSAEKESRETPLTEASRRGDVDILRELIEVGELPVDEVNKAGMNALHIAAHYGYLHIIDELLARSANVNALTDMRRTPLHLAAREGHERAVARLLAQPDVMVAPRSRQGQTPLHLAAFYGHRAAAEHIAGRMSREEINLRDYEVVGDEGDEPILAREVLHQLPEIGESVHAHAAVSPELNEEVEALNPVASDPAPQIEAEDRTVGPVELVDTDIARGIATDRTRGRRTALYSAAQSGHLEIVDMLLRAGADPTVADGREISPLLCAAFNGHVAVARRLMAALAADLEALRRADSKMHTVLHAAAFSGDAELFESALAVHGDAIEWRDASGQTPLMAAAYGFARRSHRLGQDYNENGPWRIVDRLIGLKARVDTLTEDGLTVLHYAALSNSVPFFKRLFRLCEPALATSLDGKRRSPLHLAASRGSEGIVEALIAVGADVYAVDSDGFTPLHRAAFAGHPSAAAALLRRAESGSKEDLSRLLAARSRVYGKTPLHTAADAGAAELVQLLVNKGSAIEARTWTEASTALHLAALKGHASAIVALARAGANLNARDVLGGTPLGCAARKGHLEAVTVLLDKGAEIDAPGFAGTPVAPSMAAFMPGHSALATAAAFGKKEVAELLISRGAKLSYRGARGITPLHAAASGASAQLELVDLLLEAGADPRARDDGGFTPIHSAALVGNVEVVVDMLDRNLNVRGPFDSTLMHTAVRYGQVEVLRLLKARNFKLNASDAFGRRPLHHAVINYPRSEPALVWLLKNGGDPSLSDRAHDVPAHLAARAGCMGALKLILAKLPQAAASTDSRGLTVMHQLVLRGEPGELSAVQSLTSPLRGLDKLGNSPLTFGALLVDTKETLAAGKPPPAWMQSLRANIRQKILSKDRMAVFKMLLSFPGAMQARDASGHGILHFAARAGSATVLRAVLQVATSQQINMRDTNGKTPLEYAVQAGHAELAKLLLEKGAIETRKPQLVPSSPPSEIESAAPVTPMPAGNGTFDTLTPIAISDRPSKSSNKPPSILRRVIRYIFRLPSPRDHNEPEKRR